MHWYLEVLQKYAVFNGRASRQEFWMFALFQIIVVFVLVVVLGILSGILRSPALIFLMYVYALGTFLPSLAVSIRRLHDLNKSGAWWLLNFVPFGGLVLLVWYCMAGTPGANQYGPATAASAPAVA